DIETRAVPDTATGRELVANGDIDALVSGGADNLRVLVKSELDKTLRSAITGVVRTDALTTRLADLGADPQSVLDSVDDAGVEVTVLDPPDPGKTQRQVIGVIIVALMFFGIMMYGSLVTQGVVEEKSSRIVEV